MTRIYPRVRRTRRSREETRDGFLRTSKVRQRSIASGTCRRVAKIIFRTLPCLKIGTHRPASRHRSFLSAEIDANAPLSPSEYRLRYSNHRPKRPYVFQAQPSRIFDFLPMPNTATSTPRLQASTYRTEYLDRFPNYRSFVPLEQLMPPHFSSQLNTPSIAQQKKDRMTRSQHFQDLATQHDPSPYEHKQLGDTEQRSAFRWPGLSQ